MGRQSRVLQQFARVPSPGRVKTRLQSELTAAEACAVHEELLLHTASTLISAQLAPVEIWLDRQGGHAAVSKAVDLGLHGPFVQIGNDLGERMFNALADGLQRAQSVVLVGSDCPVLSADYLASAFAALGLAEVVLGPAEDGGFVLIGCTNVHKDMFRDVPWGGSGVMAATQLGLSRTGLSSQLLGELFDIDTPADLQRWRYHQRSGAGSH